MLIRADIYQAPLQDFIQPIVDNIIKQLIAELPKLHSLYLYGSAASGTAVLGKSDIDLSVIITEPLTDHQQARLEHIQQTLTAQYSAISKIDFDLGMLNEVLSTAEFYRWGFWLKHCCQCVYGDDLSLRFPLYQPSQQIAVLLNQGYPQLVANDLHKLQETTVALTLNQLKNQICKRLIRASHTIRPLEEQRWPYQLEDYLLLFSQWRPHQIKELTYFYDLLKQTDFSKELLITKAKHFIHLLNTSS